MTEMIEGGCHCGSIRVRFHVSLRFEDLPIRACQCTFCRKHNVRATADPAGRVEFLFSDPEAVSRYRMGLAITEFLVCRRCGVYVGAVMEDTERGRTLATCVVNALELTESRIGSAVQADYDGESAGSRLERRRSRWMSATIGQRDSA